MGANLNDMYQRGESIVDKDRRASSQAAAAARNPAPGAEGPSQNPTDSITLPAATVHRDSHSEAVEVNE